MSDFEYPHYLDEMPKDIKELWEGLTEKERKFCVLTASKGNATKCAIEAGYSENSADVIASQNLSKLKIKTVKDWFENYIISNSLDTSIVSKRDILQKLSAMFIANQSNFIQNGSISIEKAIEDGSIVALSELTTRTIEGGERYPDVTIDKIKLHDPVKIAQELNKMLGNYEPEEIHSIVTDKRSRINFE